MLSVGLSPFFFPTVETKKFSFYDYLYLSQVCSYLILMFILDLQHIAQVF